MEVQVGSRASGADFMREKETEGANEMPQTRGHGTVPVAPAVKNLLAALPRNLSSVLEFGKDPRRRAWQHSQYSCLRDSRTEEPEWTTRPWGCKELNLTRLSHAGALNNKFLSQVCKGWRGQGGTPSSLSSSSWTRLTLPWGYAMTESNPLPSTPTLLGLGPL